MALSVFVMSRALSNAIFIIALCSQTAYFIRIDAECLQYKGPVMTAKQTPGCCSLIRIAVINHIAMPGVYNLFPIAGCITFIYMKYGHQ